MSDYTWQSRAFSEPQNVGAQPTSEPGTGAAGQGAGMGAEEKPRTRRLSQDLQHGVDRARRMAADGLSRAANTLRSGSTRPESTARRFADDLQRGADYVRDTDMQGMQRDLGEVVRKHPLPTLGAALLVGLWLGRRLR